MSGKQDIKVLAIVPAFNEISSISQVISELKSCEYIDHIVVIDDGSTDGTCEAVEKFDVTLLKNGRNAGVGAALRKGFKYAFENEYDLTIQFDADGQHKTSEIKKLLFQIDEFDITIGSRFSESGNLNGNYAMSRFRRAGIKVLNCITSRYVGTQLSDSTSGFRACNKKAIALLSSEMPPYYLGDTIESLFIAKNNLLKIGEVGITMENRKLGEPSHGNLMSLTRYFYLIVRLLRYLLPVRTRKPLK